MKYIRIINVGMLLLTAFTLLSHSPISATSGCVSITAHHITIDTLSSIDRVLREKENMKKSIEKLKRQQEKYKTAIRDNKTKKTIHIVSLLCSSAFLCIAAYIAFVYFKRKAFRNKILIPAIHPEKKNLQNLLSSNVDINDDTRVTIMETISLLTSILSEKNFSSNMSIKNKDRINRLAANKTGLMGILKTSYSLTHPAFVTKLEKYNLTDTEIGYCCLYASGLKGKDISFLLNNGGHSHYNMASAIRAKMGLRESDTNLSIHIKNMLEDSRT